MPVDDLGHPVALPRPPRRIVSLVPSITEGLALDVPDRLVGATDWCTHPADLDVTRVCGTKNPSVEAIRGLQADLVVANKEENRELDVRRLREAGIPVWVTDIETVPQALDSLARLYRDGIQEATPDWLAEARALWGGPLPEVQRSVIVPVWRDPWMVVGSRTFAGDLLRRLGLRNVYDEAPDRYPKVTVAEIDRDDVTVLLPDEPYVFTAEDGPEAFSSAPTELVSGRLLTWYGPSLTEAARGLARATTRDR